MINYFDGKSAATGQNARRESTMTPRNTTPVYKRHISAATTSSKKKCSKLKRNLPPQGGASQRKILKNQKLSTTLPAPRPSQSKNSDRGAETSKKIATEFSRPPPTQKPAVKASNSASNPDQIQIASGGNIPTNGAADRNLPGPKKSDSTF